MEKVYDVLILGAGPAGLTAGLYAGRSGLSAGILESIYILHCILHVYVVICRPVCYTQKVRTVTFIVRDSVHQPGMRISLGIVLGRIHVTLSIMGIVERIVIDSASSYAIFEIITALGNGQRSH